MEGVSFGADCTTAREDLRYVRVLHTGFDGETHIGELVVNRAIAEDIVEIFQSLYEASYPIEKMLLVDEYGGDDELSMEDNNTSCFNFRAVSGTEHLSQHAYGLAIDVNPLYNPYITASGYEPYNAGDYIDRTLDTPYKIDESDLCYQLFTQHGFTWGGSWSSVKDYQHFQKPIE
ncbi:MAG: M15 family metallopeptidase [Clostridiales bacterium]|nr:M15 family metallopeptidase [Clostridiales bacterium]